MPSKKFKIEKVTAREILDSRGNPTVETKVFLDCGLSAKASVPSGASVGVHEAVELRDLDKKRYHGLGVLKAVDNVNKKISRVLKGLNINDQEKIDQKLIELDGTANKSKIGANATLSASLACARAGADALAVPLFEYLAETYNFDVKRKKIPIPMFNVFNGGRHADTNLDIQELMVVPIGISKFSQQLQAGAEIFHELANVLHENYLDTDVGNEGGYAPNINSTIQAIELIMEAINRAGYSPGKQIALATDIGASHLYDESKRLYNFGVDDQYLIADQLIHLYRDLSKKYPFILIEDGLSQDDWENWEELVKEFKRFKTLVANQSMLIVGDDLLTTNQQRLQAAISRQACNAVVLKPNQIGTLSQSVEFARLAAKADYQIITSHRSGETTDDFIADLSVAISSDFVKFGSLSRGERLCKYNRLLEIEN